MRKTLCRLVRCLPLAALPGIALVAGCKEPVDNLATDNAYIRVPGAVPTPFAMETGPLMPLKAGATWEVQLKQDERLGRETDIVSTLRSDKSDKGFTDAIVETRVQGRPVRQEIFRMAGDETLMVAAGFSEKVTLSPPLPLYKEPVIVGAALPWAGVLQFRGVSAPGTGCSRITGRESVQTPARPSPFPTYRLDTVINTTIQNHPASFRIVRWLAPGVGIVRQRTSIGATGVEKTLLSYKIP